jgi:hypothetical protein
MPKKKGEEGSSHDDSSTVKVPLARQAATGPALDIRPVGSWPHGSSYCTIVRGGR